MPQRGQRCGDYAQPKVFARRVALRARGSILRGDVEQHSSCWSRARFAITANERGAKFSKLHFMWSRRRPTLAVTQRLRRYRPHTWVQALPLSRVSSSLLREVARAAKPPLSAGGALSGLSATAKEATPKEKGGKSRNTTKYSAFQLQANELGQRQVNRRRARERVDGRLVQPAHHLGAQQGEADEARDQADATDQQRSTVIDLGEFFSHAESIVGL
jgi:hypothetical protein